MAVIRNDKKFFLMTDLGLYPKSRSKELFHVPEMMVSRRHFPRQMSV